MQGIMQKVLAVIVSIGLVILPSSCRQRSGSSSTLQEDEAKLNQIQAELKSKILEFFSDKVYPGWVFKVKSKNGNYVEVKIEEMVNNPKDGYQNFRMIPPEKDKVNLAFEFKPLEMNLETGVVKIAVAVWDKAFNKLFDRAVVDINAKGDDPKAEAAKMEEVFKGMQSKVEGHKTGQINKTFQSIFELLVPRAYGQQAKDMQPMQRAFRVGFKVGFTLTLASFLLRFVKWSGKSGKTAAVIVGWVFLGSVALMILSAVMKYIVYGTSPRDDIQ